MLLCAAVPVMGDPWTQSGATITTGTGVTKGDVNAHMWMMPNPASGTASYIQYFQSNASDNARIYSLNYDTNDTNKNCLVIESRDDGDQDYISLRNYYYAESPASKEVVNVHRTKVTVDAKLGIGTTAPTTPLQVVANDTNAFAVKIANSSTGHGLEVMAGSTSATTYPFIARDSSDNTKFYVRADGLVKVYDKLQVGATVVPTNYRMAIDGKVICEELKVQDSGNWADYVFEPGYKLMSLSDLEAHVKAEKHLPGIPSAKEVAAEGISIGHMQAKMLEKIEELTLYVIELKKENESLKARLDAVERQTK